MHKASNVIHIYGLDIPFLSAYKAIMEFPKQQLNPIYNPLCAQLIYVFDPHSYSLPRNKCRLMRVWFHLGLPLPQKLASHVVVVIVLVVVAVVVVHFIASLLLAQAGGQLRLIVL